MPKKGSSKSKKSSSTPNSLTLNDYANSSISSSKTRIKKGISNPITQVKDDRDWFEKSIDEFVINSSDEHEEDDNGQFKGSRNRRKRNLSSSTKKKKSEDFGNVYNIDIWFLISKYIKPEDVGRFAGICQSANQVTKTSQFWMNLYRRYYSPLEVLPTRLQPEGIERMHGLRTSVIRALFYLYTPFIVRGKLPGDPHGLVKYQISSFWHQKGKCVHQYYFKMKKSYYYDHHDGAYSDDYYWENCDKNQQPDIIEMLGDISANSENRYRVLQVTSKDYISITPTIMNQSLLAFKQVLSASDLRYHCLKLIFGPPHTYHSLKNTKSHAHIPEGSVGVTLDGVISARVLDWYHPLYPYPSSIDKNQNNPNCDQNALEDSFF